MPAPWHRDLASQQQPDPSPTVGDVQAFAAETERTFSDALHFLTETPLSAAARAWLLRRPTHD